MTRSLKPPEWEQYPLRTAELCAGYGGLSLSIGDKHPSWVSEVDPHASRVLRDRFPYSPNLGDMTHLDPAATPEVDVLMGGTPCQDLSAAGRRAGMAEGTRSGLWKHMCRVAEELSPNVVIWENVAGARTARGGPRDSCPRKGGHGPGRPRVRRGVGFCPSVRRRSPAPPRASLRPGLQDHCCRRSPRPPRPDRGSTEREV